MTRSDQQRLADILDASEQVAELVKIEKGSWDADRPRQLAVERLLEIIGESARSMTDAGRSAIPDVPWSDLIGLRTVLAHHYHRVDPDQVWTIATVNLPDVVAHLRPPAAGAPG